VNAKKNDTTQTETRAEDGSGRRAAAEVILAIGASAAEVGSLVRVLAVLPSDTGLAAIVALQQREALDEDGLRRALGDRVGIWSSNCAAPVGWSGPGWAGLTTAL